MLSRKIRNVAVIHHGPRRHDQYFRTMFDQAAVGVARVAPDGRFLVVTQALCRMLGYSKGELLTKTCEEITHPDDRAGAAALVKKLLAGNETSYRTEKRYLRRSGSPLWVTETSSTVADRAGVVLYLVCLIQLDARRVAEEYFRSAVEAATDGMVMVNQKGKIVLVNSHTEQLFGYSREELLGRPIEALLASSFEKSNQDFISELMSHVENRPMGTKWGVCGRRRDGQIFPAELGLNPVHTLKGPWILSSIVDTSERTWPHESLHQTTVTIPLVPIGASAADTDNHKPSASIQCLGGRMTAPPAP